jgi:hypothetical protein
MEKTKNYDGHIYVKGNLQKILNTQELNSVNSSISVLFFSEDISLKQARDSLRTIKIILDELITEEENSND